MTVTECNALLSEAFTLLPSSMDTPAARRMLLAIGLQESRMVYREQIGGPARGLWQFERTGGVIGVLNHPSTGEMADRVCDALDVEPTIDSVYQTLATNDVLAACFARMLLWTDPAPLPLTAEQGWASYLRTWRPGKPHPHTWLGYWNLAGESISD